MTLILRAAGWAACAGLCVLNVAARAGEDMTPGEKSVASTMLVVSTPVFASLMVSSIVASGPAAAVRASKRERANGNMPPMRVESTERKADGKVEVVLQDPESAENTARLIWPARDDDPSSGFHVGDIVRFDPSSGGSGWLVRSPQGTELAFVPTATAAADNASETW